MSMEGPKSFGNRRDLYLLGDQNPIYSNRLRRNADGVIPAFLRKAVAKCMVWLRILVRFHAIRVQAVSDSSL
jgi:hypothetical protein